MGRQKWTAHRLAQALGISDGLVSRYRKAGMPLDLEGARAWRLEHVDDKHAPAPKQAPDAPAPGDPAGDPVARSWRDRRARAAALREEMALAVARGEYLATADVLARWQRGISDFKVRLLSIPNRVGSRMSDKALRDEVLAAVDGELYEALLDLSGTRGEPDA